MDRKSLIPKIANIQELKQKSHEIRLDVLRSLAEAGSGHLGGSLGSADIFTVLYFNELVLDPQRPEWEERDRFILSIGHVAPVYYATLAHAGFFPPEELMGLRKLGSRLQGHPGRDHGLPGLELSAGSLGQGLSVAVGKALAAKMDKKDWKVYCLCGDGEMQEGSIWEALMSAAHHVLDNLTLIIDRNGVQIDGKTSDVMEVEPLTGKLEAFGWQVLVADGHDHASLINAFEQAKKISGKPKVIIAKTKMGKGVKSIEDDYRWHGKPPAKEQLEQFISELNKGKGATS